MQQTRLNIILSNGNNLIGSFLANPWRRLSLIFVALLFGFFIASAISSTAGQEARWDITVAGALLIFTEVASIIAYRRRNNQKRSLAVDTLNAFKIGFVYGLYLEALKLGS